MVGTRRRRSNAFIVLGAGMVLFMSLLYIGWGLLNWRTGFLLFLGILLLSIINAGIVVNIIFPGRYFWFSLRGRTSRCLSVDTSCGKP